MRELWEGQIVTTKTQTHNQSQRETQIELNMRVGVHAPNTSHEAVSHTMHDAILQFGED